MNRRTKEGIIFITYAMGSLHCAKKTKQRAEIGQKQKFQRNET